MSTLCFASVVLRQEKLSKLTKQSLRTKVSVKLNYSTSSFLKFFWVFKKKCWNFLEFLIIFRYFLKIIVRFRPRCWISASHQFPKLTLNYKQRITCKCISGSCRKEAGILSNMPVTSLSRIIVIYRMSIIREWANKI